MKFSRQSRTEDIARKNASIERSGVPKVQVRMGGIRAELGAGQELTREVSRSGVDVVFAFDTTGSMTSFIDGLVQAMSDFVELLQRRNLDWRVSCVPFGDLYVSGDKIVSGLPWQTTVTSACRQLQSMPRFNGGGNGGESSFEAVQSALSKNFRKGALKVVILITDEEPHRREISLPQMKDQLVRADVLFCAVSCPSLNYSTLVELTGGTLIPIRSSIDVRSIIDLFTKLGDSIAARSQQVLELGGGSPQKLLEIERR